MLIEWGENRFPRKTLKYKPNMNERFEKTKNSMEGPVLNSRTRNGLDSIKSMPRKNKFNVPDVILKYQQNLSSS
jgi:hypothetical protein